MPRVSNIDTQLNPSVLQKMSDLSRMPEALKGNSLISYENTKDNSYIEGTSHNNSYIQNNFNLNLTGLPQALQNVGEISLRQWQESSGQNTRRG